VKGARILFALGVLAVAGVGFQRGRSPFLRIEREVSFASAVAARTGLTLDEVCALREILGVDRSEDEVIRAGRRFAELRRSSGDGEALVVATKWADEDRERARTLLARRFASMTARFAGRRPAR
jgi:precorrin-6B methylase 1